MAVLPFQLNLFYYVTVHSCAIHVHCTLYTASVGIVHYCISYLNVILFTNISRAKKFSKKTSKKVDYTIGLELEFKRVKSFRFVLQFLKEDCKRNFK